MVKWAGGVAISTYGLVLDDGKMPSEWMTGTLSHALAWAANKLAGTGGRLHKIDEGLRDAPEPTPLEEVLIFVMARNCGDTTDSMWGYCGRARTAPKPCTC